MGGKLQLDSCETYQCAFGHLIFIAPDSGEWLGIPLSLARKIQVGTEVEGKRCDAIHFAAGIWYAGNKRIRAPPSRDFVKQLANEIRPTEFNAAQEILRQMGHLPANNSEYELFSLRQDVRAGNHGRNYRGFYLPINDYLRDSGRALRISEVVSVANQTAPPTN